MNFCLHKKAYDGQTCNGIRGSCPEIGGLGSLPWTNARPWISSDNISEPTSGWVVGIGVAIGGLVEASEATTRIAEADTDSFETRTTGKHQARGLNLLAILLLSVTINY